MEDDRKLNFLQHDLVEDILARHADLSDLEVVDRCLGKCDALDGFMATIYSLKITGRRTGSNEATNLDWLIKVMKGSESFRRESLGLVLFPNEINVYRNLVPAFRELIESSGASIPFESWCPRVFFSEKGDFPGYSDQFETILVMQNVSSIGYVSGPRLDLDESHLKLMARKIAQFHACSYALRILNRSDELNKLVEAIIPLNFVQDGKIFFESYDIVFRYTQERMFKYFEAHPELLTEPKVRADIEKLKESYGATPSDLMQRCLHRDDVYSVVLHGDYNRNNVLFKYEHGNPVDVIMIDFQENRFGSPALDLSFFMYMNMDGPLRERCWLEILRCYQGELFKCILSITKLKEDDQRLDPYRFDQLSAHLSSYFIYGAVIVTKFLPVMMSNEDEVAKVAHLFQNELHSEAFKAIIQSCGGDVANRRVADVMMHCSRMGYLKFLWE